MIFFSPVGLSHYLLLGAGVFVMGLFGVVLNKNNLLKALLSLEVLLLGIILSLVASSAFRAESVGMMTAFFVLLTGAAETAVGLAIFVVYFRLHGTLELSNMKATEEDLEGEEIGL